MAFDVAKCMIRTPEQTREDSASVYESRGRIPGNVICPLEMGRMMQEDAA